MDGFFFSELSSNRACDASWGGFGRRIAAR
uniref:Uncharacterized protein n=1 Tax=Arundo donax TaxID=35708 RepID=A0A0A9ER89_ARUDO